MTHTNPIPDAQNQPEQLELLGAYSQLYLQAKRLLGLNVVLSIPLALVWAVLVAILPNLKVYSALWGVVVTLLSILVLTPTQKKRQQEAAKVQQLFDCKLLQLDWQDFHNIGGPPEYETIHRANRNYQKKNPNYDGLKDWYPDVGELPLPLARLVCQRTNCWWDAELRRQYSGWVITILFILSITVLLIGFIGELTLEKFFLAVVLPLFPAFILGITQYRENMNAAAKLDRNKDKVGDIWSRAIHNRESPDALYASSIRLQDAIFDNRSTSPLIFNWFYDLKRDEKQDSMKHATEKLIEEAKQAAQRSNSP